MAALTTVALGRSGFNITDGLVAAASGGDTYTNTGSECFVVSNAGAGDRTITFATPGTVDGLAVADRSVTVAAGKQMIFAPLPRYAYGSTVSVSYDAVTSLWVGVVKVTPEPA